VCVCVCVRARARVCVFAAVPVFWERDVVAQPLSIGFKQLGT
jgi:hypothetical protein